MNFPDDLVYTEKDEWIKLDGMVATIGITDYAQDQLSDIVYFEFLVNEGDEVQQGDAFSLVESVKAAADVYLPLSGKIMEVNEKLLDEPEIINADPYEAGWMIKIEINDPSQLDAGMDAKEYEAYCLERD
jgi:glycine cleavage system H protein